MVMLLRIECKFSDRIIHILLENLSTSSSAYLLVFHGSRDSRSLLAVSHLVKLLNKQIIAKSILTQRNYLTQHSSFLESTKAATLNPLQAPILEVAALELAPQSLQKCIIEFAQKTYKNGCRQLKILPLFLSEGVHVREDIPREIARAKTLINREITIELSTFLGKYSGMVQLLASKFAELGGTSRILVAHGSRLPGVNQDCEVLAGKLNAVTAYWSVAPSLKQQVAAKVAAGQSEIAIIPYFLFPGRITSAIASQVEELRITFPDVELILAQPLGATPELAELIVEEISQ